MFGVGRRSRTATANAGGLQPLELANAQSLHKLVGAVGFEPTRAVAPTTLSEWPLNQT